jgi:hypothetical protein
MSWRAIARHKASILRPRLRIINLGELVALVATVYPGLPIARLTVDCDGQLRFEGCSFT